MTHTDKRKLKTLRDIFNEQCKYIKRFDIITVYVQDNYIIIEQEKKTTDYNDLITKAPIDDLDIIIVRQRAILHQAKSTFNEPKGLSEAIQEIEPIDNIKEGLK